MEALYVPEMVHVLLLFNCRYEQEQHSLSNKCKYPNMRQHIVR